MRNALTAMFSWLLATTTGPLVYEPKPVEEPRPPAPTTTTK